MNSDPVGGATPWLRPPVPLLWPEVPEVPEVPGVLEVPEVPESATAAARGAGAGAAGWGWMPTRRSEPSASSLKEGEVKCCSELQLVQVLIFAPTYLHLSIVLDSSASKGVGFAESTQGHTENTQLGFQVTTPLELLSLTQPNGYWINLKLF